MFVYMENFTQEKREGSKVTISDFFELLRVLGTSSKWHFLEIIRTVL